MKGKTQWKTAVELGYPCKNLLDVLFLVGMFEERKWISNSEIMALGNVKDIF